MAIAGIALTNYQVSDARGQLKGPLYPNAFATLSRIEVIPNRSVMLSMLVYNSQADATNNPDGYIQSIDVSVPVGATYTDADGNTRAAMSEAVSMGYGTVGSLVLQGAYSQLAGSMVPAKAATQVNGSAEITPSGRVRATRASRPTGPGTTPPNLLPDTSPSADPKRALSASGPTPSGHKKQKEKNPKS